MKEGLEIKATAIIQGDIEAGTISVAEGAIINGNLKMKNDRVLETRQTKAEDEDEAEKE